MDWDVIESLGGWAVLVLVVKWSLARLDTTIKTLTGAVDQFKVFNQRMEAKQDEILREIKELQ